MSNFANQTGSCNPLQELPLLYQFSNTLLSTIRLNKLTHLILTMLTIEENHLFERAILFLLNEKTGLLQGALGVSRNVDDRLVTIADPENPLANRWDISEETIIRQRRAELSRKTRICKIGLDISCPVLKKVMKQGRLFNSGDHPAINPLISLNFLKDINIGEFVAAPLVSRNGTIGMIVVDNPFSAEKIGNDKLRLLRLVAAQSGMAIEHSILYKKLADAHSDLQDAKERLIHGERLAAIGEMAASLAHELKNPLVAIGGFAGRLFRVLPSGSVEKGYAETIVNETCRLEKMLADILAFARKPSICYSYCQVSEVLRECIESSRNALEEQAIQISESECDRAWYVLGDAHQLKQVFLNLFLNAAESMPNGGTIKIKLESQNDKLFIRIKDTGGGIPDELMPKIFHPFFTTKEQGTGLGLPIVRRIILNHKGAIEADNEDGGAIFTITLPLVKHDHQPNDY